MKIKLFVFFLSIILPLSPKLALSTNHNIISIYDIEKQESFFDKSEINVKGYVYINTLGHVYLYTDLEVRKKYLDIILNNTTNLEAIENIAGKCAVITGIFKEYSDEFIGLGWMTSEIGQVQTKSISLC